MIECGSTSFFFFENTLIQGLLFIRETALGMNISEQKNLGKVFRLCIFCSVNESVGKNIKKLKKVVDKWRTAMLY